MKFRSAVSFWITLLFGWTIANSVRYVKTPDGKYMIRRVIRRAPQRHAPQYEDYRLYENRQKRQTMPDFVPGPMNQILFDSQSQPYPITQTRRRRNLKTKRRIPNSQEYHLSKRRKRLVSQVNTPIYNSEPQNAATQWNQYPINPGNNQVQPYVILLPAQAQNPNFWNELGYGPNGNLANNPNIIQPFSTQVPVPQTWNNIFGAGQRPETQIVPTNLPTANKDFTGIRSQRDPTSPLSGQELSSPISGNGVSGNYQHFINGPQNPSEYRPLEVYTRPYRENTPEESSSSSSEEENSSDSEYRPKRRRHRSRRQYDSEDSDDSEEDSYEESDEDYDIARDLRSPWQYPMWPAPGQLAPNLSQNQGFRISEPVAVKTVHARMANNSLKSGNITPPTSNVSSNPQLGSPLQILTSVVSDEVGDSSGSRSALPRFQRQALPQNHLEFGRNQRQDQPGKQNSPHLHNKHLRSRKSNGINFPIILNEDGTWKRKKWQDEYEDSYDEGQLVNGA